MTSTTASSTRPTWPTSSTATTSTFQGLDLGPVMAGDPIGRSEIFMECWGWEELKAIRSADHLVLRDLKKEETRVYDLSTDASERHFEHATRGPVRPLVDRLIEFTGRHPRGDGPPPLDPEVIERLRELGYLGG